MTSSPPKKRLRTEVESMQPAVAQQYPHDQPPALKANGPTAKERKYDRQLRLWAAAGQAALENAHILLINSGPGVIGVETLKNLVLPGIGQFSILDSRLVDEADLGVNFFLDEDDLGKPRAEGCVRLLQELNPDVTGHAISEPFETFLTRPDALDQYTLILATLPMKPELLDIISDHATQYQKPAFYVHSIGFYVHFSVQLPSAFPIVDTHPDPAATSDLRLLEPWPELTAFAETKTANIDSMDDEEHGHIPYLLILLHALSAWRASHAGAAPATYSDKTAFRDAVRALARTDNAEGGEENFDEAVAAVLKTITPHAPSSAVREVLEAPECTSLTSTSPPFWLIARAVSTFLITHGALPLSGSVPDMKAKSADYVALQALYKAKARADAAEVATTVRALETELDRTSTPIPASQIDAFCKAAAHVKLVRGRAPRFARAGELASFGTQEAAAAVANLVDPFGAPAPLLLVFAFLAYDAYAATHELAAEGNAAQPPVDDDDTAARKITGIAHAQLDHTIKEAGTRVQDPEYSLVKDTLGNMVKELVRARGGELHNISSLAGGMVAQEVIKVVTEQYVPVDNTCVFDGVGSKTGVYRL